MSAGTPINSARQTHSYAAGDLVDPDGIVESFNTSESAVTMLVADMTGDAMLLDDAAGTGFFAKLPRTVTITRSADAGQFSDDPIVITGKRGGVLVTESLTPEDGDGDDVLRGSQAFDSLESIAFPEQGGTSGTFEIGVQDICAPSGGTFTAVKLHEDGTLFVQYGDQSGSVRDEIPCTGGALEVIAPTRVRTTTATTTTTVGLTVYLP